MAVLRPLVFPHDLDKKPKLGGEALVFDALAAALDDSWWVLYDQRIPGSRRRVDFLCLNAARGILAIEVKGGQVHDKRGAFRQLVSRKPLWRKRIDPFGQLKLALRDVFAAAGAPSDAITVHQAIWLPEMGQAGLRWQPTPHILTRELLDPDRLRRLLMTVTMVGLDRDQGQAVERIRAVLIG